MLLHELSKGGISIKELKGQIEAEVVIKELYNFPQTLERLMIQTDKNHPNTIMQIINGECDKLDEQLLFAIADCYQSQKGEFRCNSELQDITDIVCINCKAIKSNLAVIKYK